jgi:hypothetical protein
MKMPLLEFFIRHFLMFTLLISFLTFFGCEDSDTVNNQIEEIDFQIVFMDKDLKEATLFAAGDDVHVVLKIINNSTKALDWRKDYTCHFFQSPDFLLVSKRNDGSEAMGDYVVVGTPYRRPFNCPAINLPPDIISTGEKILIGFPWSTNLENQSLGPGSYNATADFEVNLNGMKKTFSLRNNFIIK